MPKSDLDDSSQKLCGLLVRKERWGLSWRGRLAGVALIFAVGFGLIWNIHSFLAVNHPVKTNVLVVEGWVHLYAIDAAVKEFKTGHYKRVFATGGPVEGTGGYSNDYNTDASVGAEELVKAGIPAEFVQMAPSRVTYRDRTYGAAVALRDWFRAHNMQTGSINVLTEDAHARRTWLLFQEAFGKDVQVGIISVPDPDIDARHWWRSSEGVREVIGEGIAYIYARFFFWPGKAN
jgi:hypothetical protein